MWRKRYSNTLLVRLQISVTTLKSSMEIPQKTRNKTNISGWGCGLSGSALAWHAWGAGFDPQHHIKIKMLCPPKTEKNNNNKM